MTIIMSPRYKQYFSQIETDVQKIYDLAHKARQCGLDPSTDVECPPARDMAGRVEKLVGPEGIAALLHEWKEQGEDQDQLCFHAMDWIIEGKFGSLTDHEKAELAIRVALAIKTEGVVSAPLEGIAKVAIRKDPLGGAPYLSLYFAGPIRAAGGTVQAFAVLCADYVRNKMNIQKWRATEQEVERFVEEVKLYDRIMNLQYPSTNEELAFAVRNLSVELNGMATETREVSAHRDVPRIETNFVRGGPCLVLNDGVLLKAKKIQKIIENRHISGWEWLKDLKKYAHPEDEHQNHDTTDKRMDYNSETYTGKKIIHDTALEQQEYTTPVQLRRQKLEEKNPPLDKYIADIIAGRPVFAYPSRIGGHRIRYGRSRNTGLAGVGLNPSVMIILEKFLAIGTQIRIERPGKSGSTMPVTSIEPPIVLLDSGDVKQIWDIKEAKHLQETHAIKKILFLGDILFGFGEFAENNHIILPSGYVEEWWAVELENILNKSTSSTPINTPVTNIPTFKEDQLQNWIQNPFERIPSLLEAISLSIAYGVGIHPRYLDHWGNLNGIEALQLRTELGNALRQHFSLPSDSPVQFFNNSLEELSLSLQNGLNLGDSLEIKTILERAFIPHQYQDHSIVIGGDRALLFLEIFGFGCTAINPLDETQLTNLALKKTALEIFTALTHLRIMDKAPYYMGSRMGRPEKAKERKMKPPVHVLFPVGHDAQLQRSLQNASDSSALEIETCIKQCPNCNTTTFLNQCPKCRSHTEFRLYCSGCSKLYPLTENKCPSCGHFLQSTIQRKVPLKPYLEQAQKQIPKPLPIVKGVKGLTSAYKVPEPIEKGILRALNEIWVYKDGTIRVDSTDIPLTHFTCKEIDVPVKTIQALGYETDIYGQPLIDDHQILEIKVQDILITHHIGDYFVKIANFVDDELEYLYHLPRFYNIKDKSELIGHYFAGLAPHTSAAIIGRLIGFTYAESGYAHPYWHAAKRRNCDGDEDGLMLLLDCLLNFSMHYLPSSLGGKMDAPLVISVILDPREVDGESHNVDYMDRYPLQFYLDSSKYPKPSELESYMILFKKHLGKESQFEGSRFTHPTQSINLGPHKSAYTEFETMNEKVEAQLYLAKIITAVDVQDVVRKIIASHFAPDILGNLRAFGTQGFRCGKCGQKYRRIPLIGKCTKCGNKLLQTVHPASIAKYLPKAQKLIKEFDLGEYTIQRWQLIEENFNSLTNNPKMKQKSLASYFR